MHSDLKILIIGGVGTNGSMEFYDPRNPEENRELSTKLLTPRFGHRSAVLEDGRVLIAGGCDENSHYLSSTEIFNPVNGEIEPGPFMNEKRHLAASAFSIELCTFVVDITPLQQLAVRNLNPITGNPLLL